MRLDEVFQVDWHTFMAGAGLWASGGNPYASFPPYPPTALSWMALFLPLGAAGFWVFSAAQMAAWWALVRRDSRSQLVLLAWSPVLTHFMLGQITLAITLAVWAVYRAKSRALGCGLLLAFAMTKPQVALAPVLYLLWHERLSPQRASLWGGMVGGTLLLALPATLHQPQVWSLWLGSFSGFKGGLVHMAAWQNWGIIPFALAAWGWHAAHKKKAPRDSANAAITPDSASQVLEGHSERVPSAGWPWWIAAGAFQQGSFYAVAALLPALRPAHNRWTLLGLGLSAALQGPVSPTTLPLILSGHLITAWLIAGGPSGAPAAPRDPERDSLASQVV